MKNKKTKIIVGSISIAAVVSAMVVVNALAFGYFSNFLTSYLGYFKLSENKSSDLDATYYAKRYDEDTLTSKKTALSEDITLNGITLLKNDSGTSLPYKLGTTFSLFSQSCDDWVGAGTGSGSSSSGKNLKNCLEEGGFKVNDTLWNFYSKGNGSSYKRGSGSISFGDGEDYRINECPASVLQSESGLESSYEGTSAVFIFSRMGGEGRDMARGMVQHADSAEDKKKNYLEPDSTELALLDYISSLSCFDDILLIINCNNAPELGWVSNYPKIHAVLQVPGTGMDGLHSLSKILSGETSPSGHLVDTYVYDNFSSPASVNCDESVYYPEGKAPTGDDASSLYYYYMTYEEGIYVGYRYYETRYEDVCLGNESQYNYDYANEVLYPFGYGLSYSEFEYSDFSISNNDDEYQATATIKNVGSCDARGVAEFYLQKPYTDYDKENGIEKASIELVGYKKSKTLKPGESETVSISFKEKDLCSYDSKKSQTYILENGDYFLSVGSDSHAALNNILREKGGYSEKYLVASPSEKVAGNASLAASFKPSMEGEIDSETYSVDSTSGNKITNQFDHATSDDIVYLSRNDWVGTYPTTRGEVSDVVSTYGNRVNGGTASDPKNYLYKMDISREDYNKIRSTSSLNPNEDEGSSEKIRFNESNSLSLVDLRGADYDDERWDDLIAELSSDDMSSLIAKAGYGSIAVSSIKKPKTTSADGPAGLSNGYGYCTEIMLAQTWDVNLATRMGDLVGEECLHKGTTGWYAPAINIHRTPFSGRNFEYYSEDPYMNGAMSSSLINEIAKSGVTIYVKHFALNDSENHRGDRNNENGRGDWGIVTWANEQSIREIYLKPFEMSIKSGTVEESYYEVNEKGEHVLTTKSVPCCMGVMTSFNRIGYTWAGGDYNLITGVLRNEWGFNGEVISDFDNGEYMDTKQALKAGADTKLNYLGTKDYEGNEYSLKGNITSSDYHYAKEAIHHVLYSEANSLSMNGLVDGNTITTVGYYVIIIASYDALSVAGIVLIAFFMIRKGKKEKEAKA